MFKPHKSICTICSSFGYIVVKARYCHRCNEEMKKSKKKPKDTQCKKTFKPIPKRSEKRIKLDAAYSVLRKAYLKDHPHCYANIKGVCTHEATEVHHLHWGKDREKYMNDFNTVVGLCAPCHRYTHDVMSKSEALERGLRKLEEHEHTA